MYKTYEVYMKIEGRAAATVTAKSQKEAEALANELTFDSDSEELIEWSFDEIIEVKEVSDS